MLVVDASVVVRAVLADEGFSPFGLAELVAPALLWSETTSALRQLRYRDEITPGEAADALERLASAPVVLHDVRDLLVDASQISELLGWAKTYDAEYVALARFLGARLVTTDARLRRTASRLVETVGPTEV
ncbi:MAG: type II toxin-antitoxin system VapC family toxin [Actinomycetota bacterium]|nr:type II toxin-antitoxin system VapC family toxin [Actinomycetota bacterium]